MKYVLLERTLDFFLHRSWCILVIIKITQRIPLKVKNMFSCIIIIIIIISRRTIRLEREYKRFASERNVDNRRNVLDVETSLFDANMRPERIGQNGLYVETFKKRRKNDRSAAGGNCLVLRCLPE